MKKASITYFKSWHAASALLLGLAILITGFTPVSSPGFDLVTHSTTVDAPPPACTGTLTTAAQGSFTNGFTYEFITDGNDVIVNVELLDTRPGLIAYIWTYNPNFAEVGMTNTGGQSFTRTFTNQTPGAAFNFAIKFAWEAGGLAVSEQLNFTVGDCQINPPVNCSGTSTTAAQGSFINGFTYEFITAGNDVTVNVELLDTRPGLVAYIWTYNPNFAEVGMTNTGGQNFTRTFTNQTPGAAFNFAIKFAWEAGGLAVSEQLNFTVGDCPAPVPTAPTTNLPNPTCAPSNVVNIFGGAYPTNIATNYNPNWGQSGFCCVNSAYDPGTGNVVLAYTNFNYQGTELTKTNLSGMTFLNFDVWTAANPSATTLQVSPINQGSGPAEVLVTVPYVQGQWTRISLPKSAFGAMTWDGVFQMKFAANGPGSTVPVDIYLDNIYFSTCAPTPPATAPSQPVGFVAINPSSSSAFLAAGPNNVGANDIVYRLFYSPTASAPVNPLDATEHIFGTIGGDGNGVSPFGFNRGGLTAATPYTFWLYQYNTVSMLYSTPAVATLTTLSPPVLPTTNAPDPTCPAGNVVSIYGDFYSPNIATNYNPNWGQTGFPFTNPNYNPGTGNVILAYTNFNYQGTELIQTNLSNMQFLNFDVWTDANPSATTLQVSPINQGTGPAEVLVTVPYVRGQWTRISLPKSAFGGMTWDGVFQMKFAANGPGSLVPVDIYLDNIFFSTTNCGDVTPPTLNCSNLTVTFNGENSIQLLASQLATATDASGPPTLTLSPNGGVITCQQVGQQVPVTVTATDANGNTATCISTVTVAGLPCGWSSNSNSIGCTSNVIYAPGTGTWTNTAGSCFYASPYTADDVAFIQRTLCGNGSITALVTSINGNGWAGVVMRENNAPGAKKAQLMTNLSNFSRREFRTATNGQAFPQQFPSQNRYWLRITRAGNQFTMLVSPNGTAWFVIGAQNIPMGNCIQMGLVTTNYTANSTVTATFSNVSFTGSNPVIGTSTEQSAEGIEGQYGFEVYPNPTGGDLNVNLTQYIGRSVRIETYSLEGKLLQFTEFDEVQTTLERLDLTGFQNGMYLVKVKSDGLPEVTRRVVVTR